MDALPSTDHRSAAQDAALTVEDFVIAGFVEGIAVRLYRPDAATAARPLPGVMYFHGGGFVSGDLDDADLPARALAAGVPAAVLSVAYSLAPARPFPAAPEDAYAASVWLRRNAPRLGIDPERLALAGDDAGGNLAATLCLILRDRNAPAPAAQVLIAPMLDPSMTRQGDAQKLGSDLSAATCSDRYAQYLPRPLERLHPYASPLDSRRLQHLPPALVATARCDLLHKEAEQYAAALIAAGVSTQVTRYDVKHAELPAHPPLLADATAFLRRQLSVGGGFTGLGTNPP